jgi:predicted RNA-binding Zn ribbon-like protein
MSAGARVDLAVVVAFVNTRDIERETDALQTAAELRKWLAEAGLMARATGPITDGDRRRAVDLREALRRMMAANNGGPQFPQAAATVQEAARHGGLAVAFGEDGSLGFETTCDGVSGALSALLVPVAEAMGDGRWTRVKACREPGCQWAFYDRSRNRAGVWCDMAVCGNRTKVRSYRARRRGPRE